MIKPEAAKILAVWLTDISGEVTEAKKLIAPLEGTLQSAESAFAVASASTRDLERTLDGFSRFPPAIALRLGYENAAVDFASRDRNLARVALKNERAHIAELQAAVRALDALLAVEESEVAA
jgi:hypothetical protein